MSFFRIVVDPGRNGAWFPGEPVDQSGNPIDARLFIEGRSYLGRPPAHVPLATDGLRSEFTLCAFDMPVVSRRVGNLFSENCPDDIQRFPVTIAASEGYDILNVVNAVSCLDESLSMFSKWQPGDERPENAGEYKRISRIRIDPSKVRNLGIFRVKGWEVALIISRQLKDLLEKCGDLGVVFQSVS